MKKILAALIVFAAATAWAESPLYNIPLKDIDKKETSLKKYEGKVLLVVNVASECGLTPQYTQLEELQKKFGKKGFTVLGFPCNQFGGQEPGTNEEIKTFCSKNYGVTFPMFDKVDVKGTNQHPLYKELAGSKDVGWNFGKFLIGKDGKLIARFEPRDKPDSKKVVGAIQKALK